MSKVTASAERVLPISALSQQAQRLVEQVHGSTAPLIITKHGRSTAVLLDAEEYEQQLRRLALMERIAQGKRDIAEGRTHSQEEVETLLDEWFGSDG